MKNKNYIDKKSEQLLHDITERLDYILGRQEPEDMEEQLWQWLLIINGEASRPALKDIKCIKLLYKRMMVMVDTGYQLQYLDKRTGVRVSDADEKQILNPAYALDDDKNAVYANTCMLHEGRIKTLAFEECLDPYKFIQSFFEYRSILQWKNCLKYWKIKATGNQAFFDGGLIENPLETYRYLVKMIEICFILFEIEYNGKPNTPFNYFFIRDNMPAYCSVEMILWPFEGLYRLFERINISELESGIQSWWAGTKRRHAWKGTATELIRLHETVQMMIELGFMIKCTKYFQETWLQPEDWNFRRQSRSSKTSTVPDTPYLTSEEKQNPFLVLIKNCKLDIGWFRDELNKRLEAALDTEMNLDDTYDTLGNIIKIIEALYVINDAIPDAGKRQRLFDLQSAVMEKG
ncbi:MAG TPA: hypothetical protein VN726_17295 [Hanamia sp.]|nr:hypothetical protein [Hanamia sp.]